MNGSAARVLNDVAESQSVAASPNELACRRNLPVGAEVDIELGPAESRANHLIGPGWAGFGAVLVDSGRGAEDRLDLGCAHADFDRTLLALREREAACGLGHGNEHESGGQEPVRETTIGSR